MKARTISTLIVIARSLFNKLAAMAIPCSVKVIGNLRLPPLPPFDIPNWNIKEFYSSLLREKAKSSGNRSMFLLIALLKLPVLTPYSTAKS